MNTRDRILDAAYNLIAKHGYDKTTIALICDEVKVKKPSVYYYFKSKEEILLTIIDQMTEYAQMLDIPKKFNRESFKEDLINYGFDSINFTIKNPTDSAVELEIYAQVNRLESVREKIGNYSMYTFKILKEILNYGVEISALPKGFDVDLNASILAIALDGINSAIIYNQAFDYKTIWQKSIDRMFLEINK